MPEYIRVRVKGSGTEQTIAKPTALNEDAFTLLDEPATDHNGRALPPKFATKKKAGQSATTTKKES